MCIRDSPAGTQADALGAGGGGRDEQRRAAARDAGHRVVLGRPVPVQTQAVGVFGAPECRLDRRGVGLAVTGPGPIQQGQPEGVRQIGGCHAPTVAPARETRRARRGNEAGPSPGTRALIHPSPAQRAEREQRQDLSLIHI